MVKLFPKVCTYVLTCSWQFSPKLSLLLSNWINIIIGNAFAAVHQNWLFYLCLWHIFLAAWQKDMFTLAGLQGLAQRFMVICLHFLYIEPLYLSSNSMQKVTSYRKKATYCLPHKKGLTLKTVWFRSDIEKCCSEL